MIKRIIAALLMTLAGCSRHNPAPANQPAELPTRQVTPAPASRAAPSRPAPRRVEAPADPKSTEAAIELVKGFVGLLNGGRFDEAYMLLGPGAPPRSTFDSTWSKVEHLKVELGNVGEQEGAAGSIYLSVALHVSGLRNGQPLRATAPTVVLRRVNDVPGSTDAQRHWHIERVDWDG